MNKIIPSTKLKIVTVHKLQETSCWRRYFWSRVLNLEPRKISFPFWWGGVLHAGFEAVLLGRPWPKAQQAMAKESRRRTRRYQLTPLDIEELKIKMELLYLTVKGSMSQERPDFDIRKMSIKMAEKQNRFRLKKSGLLFCGILDGIGKYDSKDSLYEIKTASSVSNNFFTTLTFDTQIHAYALSEKKSGHKPPSMCAYCVFRKPQKRLKKGQIVSDYVKEIQQDIADRPEWYYILFKHNLGRQTITETGKDLEADALILQGRYDSLTKKELLNPDNWPRRTSQCLRYGICPFLTLCKYPKKWKLYLRLYQQREMMYEEEKGELQK